MRKFLITFLIALLAFCVGCGGNSVPDVSSTTTLPTDTAEVNSATVSQENSSSDVSSIISSDTQSSSQQSVVSSSSKENVSSTNSSSAGDKDASDDDYYEDDFDDNELEGQPEYDTSKASGILASMGMTEQQFRDSCMPLSPSVHPGIFIKTGTKVPYVELQDLQRNPTAYVGQHFVFSENPFEDLPCNYCHGEDASRMPSKPCTHKGPGHYNYAELHDDGLYYYRQYNLNKLVPDELLGRNRFTNNYGESVISNDYCLIFDLRDNIYSPNITKDSYVSAYMIFDGMSQDGSYLMFSMISCDVRYE